MMLPLGSLYGLSEGGSPAALHGMRLLTIPTARTATLHPWCTIPSLEQVNLASQHSAPEQTMTKSSPERPEPLKFGIDRILSSSPPPSSPPSSPSSSSSSEEPEPLTDSPQSASHPPDNASPGPSHTTTRPHIAFGTSATCPRTTPNTALLFPHGLLPSYPAGSVFPGSLAPPGTDPSSLPLHPNPAAVVRHGWSYLTPHYHGYPLFSTGNHSRSPGTDTGQHGKRKRSWSRAVFSALQRKGLEKRFDVQKYVTKPDRRQLAAMLGLTDAQVKVWFQNRRMKWRHQMEAAKKAVQERQKPGAADSKKEHSRTTHNKETHDGQAETRESQNSPCSSPENN